MANNAITLNDVKVMIDGKTAGMIQTVEVNVTINKSTLYQAGDSGKPKDVAFFKKEITGTFERILLSKDLLVQLWPDMDGGYPIKFDLSGQALDTTKGKDINFTVSDCTIDGFPISMDLEAESKQSIAFTGLGFKWG